MLINIIGVEDCIYCAKAKWLTEMPGLDADVNYMKISRDEKPSVVALIGQDFKTYPVVVLDGEYIGGFSELSDILLLDEEGKLKCMV